MGRREYLYENILRVLMHFKDVPPKHKVKIGTVVSKINVGDLVNIGNFLFRNPALYKPDVWRVYQFEALNRGLENREAYQISDEEFKDACKRIQEEFPEVAINPRSHQDYLNAYFFITPDLMIQTMDVSPKSFADLTTVTQEDLTRLIKERTETAQRAEENRKWVTPTIAK